MRLCACTHVRAPGRHPDSWGKEDILKGGWKPAGHKLLRVSIPWIQILTFYQRPTGTIFMSVFILHNSIHSLNNSIHYLPSTFLLLSSWSQNVANAFALSRKWTVFKNNDSTSLFLMMAKLHWNEDIQINSDSTWHHCRQDLFFKKSLNSILTPNMVAKQTWRAGSSTITHHLASQYLRMLHDWQLSMQEMPSLKNIMTEGTWCLWHLGLWFVPMDKLIAHAATNVWWAHICPPALTVDLSQRAL